VRQLLARRQGSCLLLAARSELIAFPQSRLDAKLQLQFSGDPTLALICQNEIESGEKLFSDSRGKTFAAEVLLENEVKVLQCPCFWSSSHLVSRHRVCLGPLTRRPT
jgi:hypothetical protein